VNTPGAHTPTNNKPPAHAFSHQTPTLDLATFVALGKRRKMLKRIRDFVASLFWNQDTTNPHSSHHGAGVGQNAAPPQGLSGDLKQDLYIVEKWTRNRLHRITYIETSTKLSDLRRQLETQIEEEMWNTDFAKGQFNFLKRTHPDTPEDVLPVDHEAEARVTIDDCLERFNIAVVRMDVEAEKVKKSVIAKPNTSDDGNLGESWCIITTSVNKIQS
jgi:hypothetical protein